MRVLFALGCVLLACELLGAWAPQPAPEPVVEIKSMAVTPDGKHLLIGLSDGTKEGHKGEKALIRMIDLDAGKEVKSFLGHKRSVTSLAVTPDGKHLVSTGWDENVWLWSVKTAKPVRQFEEKSAFPVAAVSSDGKKVVTCPASPRTKAGVALTIWNVETAKREKTLEGIRMGIRGVHFSPNGEMLVLQTQPLYPGEDFSSVKILDIKTGKTLKSFNGKDDRWNAPPVFTPDSCSLLLQKADIHADEKPAHNKHHLVLWDVKAGKETARHFIAKQNHPVDQTPQGLWMRWLFLRKDGKRAFVVDDVGGMALLDLKSGKKAWQKKLTLSKWVDEVFQVSEGKALVVSLKVAPGPQAQHPTRYGATIICSWFDLDTGKELKTKEITIKW